MGYRLRPGVAASVYLAYTLEIDSELAIPAGTRAQSVPGPGELPQTFETAAELDAHGRWNVLKPRFSQPKFITKKKAEGLADPLDLYFKGITTLLKPGDPLLFVFGQSSKQQVFRRVARVEPEIEENRIRVALQVPVNIAPLLDSKRSVFDETIATVRKIITHYSRLDAFEVSSRSAAARRVTQNLDQWIGDINTFPSPLPETPETKLNDLLDGLTTLLGDRPLGVKEVINPMEATGGADKESRDQSRRNAPLAVTALDRLVSTQDYADFARTFAGIAKAGATQLPDGRQQIVYLTIAGADDIPIDLNSDLWRSLHAALRRFGDPYQPFQIAMRELVLLVVSANVSVHPDYQWEKVEPQVRAALLDAFSFERRDLGQSSAIGSRARGGFARWRGARSARRPVRPDRPYGRCAARQLVSFDRAAQHP